jgi:hypothetical protein
MDSENDKSKKQKVGYKSPPKHSQFKKGQSGNPKGRKKHQPPTKLFNPYDAIPGVLARKITLTVDKKPTQMSIGEAMWLSTGVKAATGNLAATKLIVDMINRAPPEFREKDTYLIQITEEDRALIKRLKDAAIAYGADENELEQSLRDQGLVFFDDDEGEDLKQERGPPDETKE